ncbi:alpha-tocopherol transfer protein-like [Galendromus occidentalis]|uniref:Alpha-tocopherol transfer protein-like n=1 Tax=Galendromus occidentalis TaxID=34638 RepID=A0AAJ6QTP2_9ACAR|nr:alpha-tocopherol transfer protein-like [Galendromus occidentalis]
MTDPVVLSDFLVDTTTFTIDHESEETQDAVRKLRNKMEGIMEGSEAVVPDRELVKTLRYKKFDVDKAFRMAAMTCRNALAQNLAHMPFGKGPKDFGYVYALRSFELLRHRNPKDGSAVVVLRAGDWTPDSGVNYTQVLQGSTYIVDHMLEDDEIQKNGARVILDYKGLHLSWILQFLPPHKIPSVLSNLQGGCPLKIRAIHIVNQPVTYNVAFALAAPFLSKKNEAKIQLHGSQIEALHEYIDRSILPKDLLGEQEPHCEWFFQSLNSRHDEYVARSELARKANRAAGNEV